MRKENIDFLEANRDCYTEVLNAETALKANKITEDLLRIVREEFYPAYSYKGDCGDCLFTLVKTLYITYDKWKATQPKIVQEEPLIVATGFPKDEPPEDSGIKIPIIETVAEFGTISEDGKGMNLLPMEPKINITYEPKQVGTISDRAAKRAAASRKRHGK